MKTKMTSEIENELYLYHCAAGHTRAQMARARLIEVGFEFRAGVIFWPDGVMLTYKDGNIDYRNQGGR